MIAIDIAVDKVLIKSTIVQDRPETDPATEALQQEFPDVFFLHVLPPEHRPRRYRLQTLVLVLPRRSLSYYVPEGYYS